MRSSPRRSRPPAVPAPADPEQPDGRAATATASGSWRACRAEPPAGRRDVPGRAAGRLPTALRLRRRADRRRRRRAIVNFNVPAFTSPAKTSRPDRHHQQRLRGRRRRLRRGRGVHQPEPAYAPPPNNVLAPCWTDLNPGRRRAPHRNADRRRRTPGSSSNGRRSGVQHGEGELVPDLDRRRRRDPRTSPSPTDAPGNGDGGFLTVGAENRFGNRGQNSTSTASATSRWQARRSS